MSLENKVGIEATFGDAEIPDRCPERLTTPAILVDRWQLGRNIEAMGSRLALAGAQLWPHVKTHKSLEIARLQVQAGANGVSAATLHEAEVLADNGFSDILLAYPPAAAWRRDRVVGLARRCRLLVACDDVPTLLDLDEKCAGAGVTLTYLWEVDCGLHRCGTEPGPPTAAAVAEVRSRTRATTFGGLMTFPGHAYGARSDAEIDAIALQELDAIRTTTAALAERGIDCPVVSIGSTPTILRMPADIRGTLARPGNYVFYDATQVALGVAEIEDCALTVLATVISRVAPDRLVLDSGSKALSSDRLTERTPGFGIVVGHPELTIVKLFEEHAIVHGAAGALSVGDRVRVIPNHACAVVNLHPVLHVVEGKRLSDRWLTRGRGWT